MSERVRQVNPERGAECFARTREARYDAAVRGKRLRIAGAMAIVLLITLVGTEAILRGLGRAYQHRYWQRVNADHAASRSAATVLAIGESTTGGLWVPFEHSYPKQLEALLRAHYRTNQISVVVPPHIGQNTSQALHRFLLYLNAFHPHVVIIMAGVNNSWALSESNLARFLPADEWRTQVFRWRTWLHDVKVLRLFRLMWTASGEAVSTLGGDLAGAPRFTEWPPKTDILGPVEPNSRPFLDLWRHDVGEMIDMAQRSGAVVMLMTYPNYDTPPPAEIRAMARAKGASLVDNDVTFRPLLVPGVASKYFFGDYHHPTAEGYAILADSVVRVMLSTPTIAGRLAQAIEAAGLGAANATRP